MGLFAQVGGAGTTTIWRISFVGIAVVGLVATPPGAAAQPPFRASTTPRRGSAAVVIYALIAVVGRGPRDRPLFNLTASRSRRSC